MNLTIICDGGSRGNHTGEGGEGYGSFVIQPGICEQRFFQHFGKATNNEAEYLIVITALEYLLAALEVRKIDPKQVDLDIRSDSQLVIGHLVHGWKVKAVNLLPLVARASKLTHSFGRFTFIQTPRKDIQAVLGH